MSARPRSNSTLTKASLLAILLTLLISLTACAVSGSTNESSNSSSNETVSNTAQTVQNDNSSSTTENTLSARSLSGTTTTTGESITLRYLDVGQGDSTLIECDGHWMLIDGGKAEKSNTIYAVLQKLNVGKLDVIIATHPDADHIGGISGALNYTKCDVCYCSTLTSDTKTFTNMVNYLQSSSGIGLTVPAVGDSFALGGAAVTFLGPVKQFDSDNNNSLIVRIDYGSTSFLFTGDAEKEAESALVSSDESLKADVLQVGHHGSKNSSTTKFLNAVSPKYSVVSVGENSYGHPTEATLSRLESVGSTILRTDQLGDITFVSDGTNLSYTTSKV